MKKSQITNSEQQIQQSRIEMARMHEEIGFLRKKIDDQQIIF